MDDITIDAAAEALTHVSPADRATRVRMGEALKDHFGEAGQPVFDAWYSGHDRYTEAESKSAWRSFGRGGGGKAATISTLIWEAKRCGWRPTSYHQARYSADEAKRRAAEREARRAEAARVQAEEQAAAAERAAEIWSDAQPADGSHPYLARKGVPSHGLRRAAKWVIEWIRAEDGEVVTFEHADPLLVPIWSSPGKLASLQAILPSRSIGRPPKRGEKDERRDKDYLKGGRKDGCYHVIGSIGAETALVAIGEGYATCASVHAAVGCPVMVAFDAGNLEAVASMVRKRLPRAAIVILADNDQFHTPRADGSLYNPGVEAATKAAKAVSGIVAVPQFADLSGEPTDFNDLHLREGLTMVKAQFDVALNPPPPPPPPPPPEGEDEPPFDVSQAFSPEPPPPDAPANTPTAVFGHDPGEFFRILGYDHEVYYFLSAESKQVIVRTKGDFSDSGLLELAPLEWWEMEFPGAKGGIDKPMAANWIIRSCRHIGIYDNRRIRGRGAWVDDGRIIYHHGEKLSVDGAYTSFDGLRSRYVYEMDRALPEPAEEPLTPDWGEWLLDLAAMFRWSREGSAPLLAGWIALAPVCGALRWRPHLWITGGAGSGKTTVLNEYVHCLLGGVNLYAQGNSSEAGIRQSLKADALPVLFDETESNEEGDARRIQNVLSLVRQASSESQALTLKGTAGGDAMAFMIRSMFCLSSIQVALKHQADIERLAVLSLRPKREESNAAEKWQEMQKKLAVLKAERDLPAKLLRRALNLLPVTLKSIDVFVNAFAIRSGSVRDGDQYGTMLAGAWSLISDRVPTETEAFEFIDRYDWTEHLEQHDTDDSMRALSYLLESRVRLQGGIEVTINELVREAASLKNDGFQIGAVAADAMLQRYGIRLTADNRHMLLSNESRSLRSLLSDTQFAADIRGMLLRVPGATRYDNKAVRFNGAASKCVSIPLAAILANELTV